MHDVSHIYLRTLIYGLEDGKSKQDSIELQLRKAQSLNSI